MCSLTEHTVKTRSARHAGTDRVIGYSVRFSSVRRGKCRGSASDYAMTASFKPFHVIKQGVSGGIVNILGGGIMDYSEQISSYKHVSNFQWVWRYSCLKLACTDPIILDFVLWGWMKREVYKEKVNTRDELVASIMNSVALIKQ